MDFKLEYFIRKSESKQCDDICPVKMGVISVPNTRIKNHQFLLEVLLEVLTWIRDLQCIVPTGVKCNFARCTEKRYIFYLRHFAV